MTQHSLATQAVLDSIKAIDFDWSNMEQADSTIIVAAALRAVAEVNVGTDYQNGKRVATILRSDILVIATELEAFK